MGSEFFIKLEKFLIIIKLESIKLERSDCSIEEINKTENKRQEHTNQGINKI